MVKEDIIRGLEGAMSRGESLEKAMYSFYNAGYKKEDVEEAARALSLHLSQQESLIPRSFNIFPGGIKKQAIAVKKAGPNLIAKFSPQFMAKPAIVPMKKVQETMAENPNIGKKPRFAQEVSKYEVAPRMSPKTILIIILSVLLANLLAALAGIFLFREAIFDFFNNFFSNIVPA